MLRREFELCPPRWQHFPVGKMAIGTIHHGEWLCFECKIRKEWHLNAYHTGSGKSVLNSCTHTIPCTMKNGFFRTSNTSQNPEWTMPATSTTKVRYHQTDGQDLPTLISIVVVHYLLSYFTFFFLLFLFLFIQPRQLQLSL